MPDQRDALRNIHTFPQLIKFLRDEMDWPIESENFEELTFDYSPEELGIDAASAAKIQEIKRLRPLSAGQPWGIFFVKFEPRRLPVIALRRILSRVVLKKRASANSAERAAWQADDLLFISNYGEGDDRQISFAHFSVHRGNADLPTLRVLGWDTGNTALHLDDVADKLTTKLSWPQGDDAEQWRERWRSAFTMRHREVITTSKLLAERLADLARSIRERANTVLQIETDKGPLRKLHTAFRAALIHDLSEDDFADMYAQTIAYGLLTARVSRPSGLVAENLRDMVPVTNPFLKDLLDSFLAAGGRKGKVDFDELGVNDVVQLLRDADMEAVLRDFGDRNPEEDPAIHFYELFLKEYDPKKRMQRGVFYTPRPVVSYIVRSVHELLQTEYRLEGGLASTVTWGEMAKRHKDLKIPDGTSAESAFVQILDPATGTATFLVEVIDVIYRTLEAAWKRQRLTEGQQRAEWNDYVSRHLLPRLHGYELMMAPYAIAHMKIGLKLYETGYRFASEERARIYLTNALEPPSDDKEQREFEELAPALAHEAQAVNVVKRDKRFTVIIGNPPYSVSTQNRGIWATSLIDRYKVGLNEKKHTLDDDYVKFVALAQWHMDKTPMGLWGFITNHGYLKNPTFRGMRQSLLRSFCVIRVYDLHGNLRQKEIMETGGTDENVFDIQQGVAITIGTAGTEGGSQTRSYFAELWGTRVEKYGLLGESNIGTTNWNQLSPREPYFLLIPQNEVIRAEYVRWPSLTEVFVSYGSGIKTDRDELCIDFMKTELAARMKLLFSKSYDSDFIERYNVRPSSSYDVVEVAHRTRFSEADLTQCLYRPFDVRWLYYRRGFTSRPAHEVMRHMLPGGNIGLLSARTNKSGKMDHFFCSNLPTEVKVAESTTQSCLFPLYIGESGEGLRLRECRALNLSQSFVKTLAVEFKLPQQGLYDMPEGVQPEDIFNYSYAVFHSPGYRNRYAEFLKIDFPRLPLTKNLVLFRSLSNLGGEIVALHLLQSAKLDTYITTYSGNPNLEIEKISHTADGVWLDKARTRGFRGVSEEVWNFHIGGYQVCEKWLKDRKGRTLSKDDIAHYHKIVVALSETIRLMAEIDKVIDAHGGWPDAFTQSKS